MNNLEARGHDIVQAAPQSFINVDLEADGIAGMGSILSIGAISPHGETFYRELKPLYDRYIPGNSDFCKAHGLDREQLKTTGQDPLDAITDFTDWAKQVAAEHNKSGTVFTAFNASYDFPLVDLYTKEANIDNPFGVAGFCIKSLAIAITKGQDWRATSKSKLPKEIVPPADFTHHALEDAIYQQRLHFGLIGLLDRNNML